MLPRLSANFNLHFEIISMWCCVSGNISHKEFSALYSDAYAEETLKSHYSSESPGKDAICCYI